MKNTLIKKKSLILLNDTYHYNLFAIRSIRGQETSCHNILTIKTDRDSAYIRFHRKDV